MARAAGKPPPPGKSSGASAAHFWQQHGVVAKLDHQSVHPTPVPAVRRRLRKILSEGRGKERRQNLPWNTVKS